MQQWKHGQRVVNAPVQVPPSHCLSYSVFNSRNREAAPAPKLGKCPVRRGGLSFHCYSYPHLTPPSCWYITGIRLFSEHVKECLKQRRVWAVTSTDNSWFDGIRWFVRKETATKIPSFVKQKKKRRRGLLLVFLTQDTFTFNMVRFCWLLYSLLK